MNFVLTTETTNLEDSICFYRHEYISARGADEKQAALFNYLRYFVRFDFTTTTINTNTVYFVWFTSNRYFVKHAAPLDVALATDVYSAPHSFCCVCSYHTVTYTTRCEHSIRC
jgi:hypothetical protein